ncbi:MAG: hypothetical protein H7A42_08090 [Chlamydiales bacterium]|nr:hypothetical protein [Chlamydiales bacterium]
MQNQDVPRRANHVLHLLLIIFLLILIRVWYLSVIKHDTFQEKARRPQRKTLIEPAARGTIRDRFNIPLAINQTQYNAAVCYDRIREIPVFSYEKNGKGKKVRVFERRRYVENLAKLLGQELAMDPVQIEDLIHSQASIFPNTPFVIKEDISEETYCRLRALEKDWVGLEMQRGAKRYYPLGKVGSDIVGYMGAINDRQYYAIAEEMQILQDFLKKREEGLPAALPKGFKRAREVSLRYDELKERAYTIHARVGKMGIERVFDEELRGLYGKRQIEIGAKGRLIRNLPGKSESVSGKRILLTISSELQEFAESLLVQSEKDRQGHFPLAGKNHDQVAPPWIHGGAIVAMIPQTGEVVALASYPRLDPNDFTAQNNERIHQWLETPRHIANIWDGKAYLMREKHSFSSKGTYEEKELLSWDHYLDQVLSLTGTVRKIIKQIGSIQEAVELLHLSQALMKLAQTSSLHGVLQVLYSEGKGHTPSHLKLENEEMQRIQQRLNQEVIRLIKIDLDPYLEPLKHNDDKLLFFDLLQLAVNEEAFSEVLLGVVGKDSLGLYRSLCQAFVVVEDEVKAQVKTVYHERIFPIWRKENFKAYLKEKREEEKAKKTYEHPYTDYLSQAESKLFQTFWETHKWSFLQTFIFGNLLEDLELKPFSFHLALKRQELERGKSETMQHLKRLSQRLQKLSMSEALSYLKTMRPFRDLTNPLWGHYYGCSKPRGEQTLQDLASFFYPKNGMGFGKSYAYGRATTLGSLFKPVTGYEALKQEYLQLEKRGATIRDLNPLTLYDEINPQIVTDQGTVLGRTLDGKWITRQYKGGRLPRSHASLGKIDFLEAMERSSNIYFSLLAGEVIDHPSSLYDTTREFGFGSPTGIDLIGEIAGYVPDDIRDNRTGLYAFAIGQHSLVVTPLQASVMLSTLANGGEVLKPQVVNLIAGVSILNDPAQLFASPRYAYQDYLKSAGLHFPLFTETQKIREEPKITPFTKEVRNTLFMPREVQTKLFDSLYQVVWGEKGPAQPYRIRSLLNHPKLIHDYKSLKNQFIGKTSTAEFVYRPTLDRELPPLICKDIWFGAISFSNVGSDGFDPMTAQPELVVIVYLRFGDYGKEAAPIAAQIIKKWREITQRD